MGGRLPVQASRVRPGSNIIAFLFCCVKVLLTAFLRYKLSILFSVFNVVMCVNGQKGANASSARLPLSLSYANIQTTLLPCFFLLAGREHTLLRADHARNTAQPPIILASGAYNECVAPWQHLMAFRKVGCESGAVCCCMNTNRGHRTDVSVF